MSDIEYKEPTPYFYSVGVDLGSVNDSTAITVLEVQRGYEGTPEVNAPTAWSEDIHYLVRLMHRPRLGVPYPQIIEQVAAIFDDLPPMPQKAILVADSTGLGAPIVQQMRKQGLHVTGISITAGNVATLTGNNWGVPKALLVGELRLAMHRKRLRVAQGFAARETLATELAAFTAKLSPSGRASFEAAGSEHDDTVLSLSLALFAAKQRCASAIRFRKALDFANNFSIGDR